MLAEPALAALLAGPLAATGLPKGAVPGVAVVIGMLLASAVQMVVGELVPKNWAVSRPLQVARFVAGPQHAFSRAFRPVIAALNAVANRLVRALGVEPTEEMASARTPASCSPWSAIRRRPAPSNRTPPTSSYGPCRWASSRPSTS